MNAFSPPQRSEPCNGKPRFHRQIPRWTGIGAMLRCGGRGSGSVGAVFGV